MILNEIIKRCEEKAKELSDKAYAEWGKSMTEEQAYNYNECAREYEQLARWLKELNVGKGESISRENLKKSLHNFFDGKVIDEPAYILRDVFCIIDNTPTVPLPDFKDGYKQAILDGKTNFLRPQSEWIPVSERLPEALQSVLVTSKSGRVYTSYIAHGDWEYGGEVIAWQPLPEPYQKGGAE